MENNKTDNKNLIKATLSGVRISPRKVKPVAANIKGLNVKEVSDFLDFNSLKAAGLLSKLVKSGYSNAMNKNNGFIDESNVIVKDVIIGPGMTLKRAIPAGKGSSKPIRKRSSNISVFLEVKEVKESKEETK